MELTARVFRGTRHRIVVVETIIICFVTSFYSPTPIPSPFLSISFSLSLPFPLCCLSAVCLSLYVCLYRHPHPSPLQFFTSIIFLPHHSLFLSLVLLRSCGTVLLELAIIHTYIEDLWGRTLLQTDE